MLASDKQLKELVGFFRRSTKLVYKKGEFIIRPGETPPGVFYIEKGLVKAYDITKYGEENLLIIRKGGEFLGLTFTVTGDDRHIIYQALDLTHVWLVGRDQLISYIKREPEISLPLLEIVTEMYRQNSERILNLEYRTVRERLISFLLGAAKRFGKKTRDGTLIIVPLRHQDIASSINSSRETTTREMAYLERKGLVNSERSYITLKDVKKLQSYL